MRLTFVSLIDLVYNPAEAGNNRLLPHILNVNLGKVDILGDETVAIN